MSTSVKATEFGVEFREGDRRIRLYKHQLPAVADYLHDHWERLDSNTTNTQEDKK